MDYKRSVGVGCIVLNRPIEINSVVDSDKYTSNVVVWTKAPRLLKPLFFGY